jgi:hypothetical protein
MTSCACIEILGSQSSSSWRSLSSISFESNSQLKRIESGVLDLPNIENVILSTIQFVAFDAIVNPSRIRLEDRNSCPQLQMVGEIPR